MNFEFLMYHSYHTHAFILGSFNSGEANKFFLLYTKDLGFVQASAQGVRFAKSKLRYYLQDFSYVKVSLVRGKDIWRITGAEEVGNIESELRNHKDIFFVFARIFSLLRRLLHGEEKNEKLFEHIVSAYDFSRNLHKEPKLIREFEYIFAMRILKSLGYIGDSEVFDEFVSSNIWSDDLLLKLSPIRADAIFKIRDSLKETQL